MVICTPFPKPGCFYYNQKINCMRAEGTVTYGYHNRTYTFDPADSFAVLGVKLWADGSPYTGSMFSRSAYLDSPLNRTLGITPGSYGQPLLGVAALREKIEHYNRAGWQVAIHSQGDASLLEVARALEQAAPLSGQAPAVRLEHAIELPKPLMPELTAQGVAVSFHINHLLY